MANRGAVCWESHLSGSERGWRATLVWMEYSGTAGKPGGKQRKQTSSYSQGSLQPTRTASKGKPHTELAIVWMVLVADPLQYRGRPMSYGKKWECAP